MYYDGSNNLNAVHVDCGALTSNQIGCSKQFGCNWCLDRCVTTPKGPINPCLSFPSLVSAAPSPTWDPASAGSINVVAKNLRGESQIILTHSPNMADVNVYKPYK